MVCTACLWGAMPLAIAAFTSVQPLSVNKLEPELQESLRAKGYSDTNVYFERGVYVCLLYEMEETIGDGVMEERVKLCSVMI